MIWRFTLVDRNNISTEIEEPVGWDQNTCEITRDADYHGIVFTNQGDNFQFDGPAMQILKTEYETYGAQGIMTLVLEEDCGLGFQEFSRGKFLFSKYEFICGDECYVKIPIENSNEVMDLRNKINQKVNLDSLKAFDETTDLPLYAKLPFGLSLPSKAIFVKDHSLNDTALTEVFAGTTLTPSSLNVCHHNWGFHHIVFGFTKQIAAEIGNYSFLPTPSSTEVGSGRFDFISAVVFDGFTHQGACSEPFKLDPLKISEGEVINLSEGSPNYDSLSDNSDLSYRFKGNITVQNTYIGNSAFFFMVLPDRPEDIANGTRDEDYIYLQEYNITCRGNTCPDGSWSGPGTVLPFDIIYSNPAFHLKNGDRIFIFIAVEERKTQDQVNAVVDSNQNAWEMTTDTDSFFKLTNFSKTLPTISKVYAINEAISRVVESVTNDSLRLYSDYFGRTDSEPYAAPADGCGSLEVITDGLRLRRQENKVSGQTSVFSQSLQDMFDGLVPIHNIGMGLEPDPNRTGYNRLRVEYWKFFYNDTLVLSCLDIDKITHTCNEREIYSTFQFGYAKWEAEEYTGLDEFLTKRSYRTTINSVKNDLVKLSKWIASGYALEITRRKGNEDSKDWRYDKDTFIICCKRGAGDGCKSYTFAGSGFPVGAWAISGSNCDGTAFNFSSISGDGQIPDYAICAMVGSITTAGNITVTEGDSCGVPDRLIVELGNVINAENIVDPPTLYNYRISPVRNAMRWMNKVLESYRIFDPQAKIIFTDGDANYFAKGEMESPDCRNESGVLAENQTIDPSIYADENVAKPFLMPERIVFDYPMSSADYKLIEGNPYGKIAYTNDCEEGFGYIDKISYKPETGIATFTLIPAVDQTISGCVPVAIQGNGLLPAGTVGTPYSFAIYLYGSQPFVLSNVIKPAWMSISLNGSTIFFSGTPPAAILVVPVSFDVSNCAGVDSASFVGTIDVIEPVCIQVAITGSPSLPDGFVNTAYSYSIPLTGDAPFLLTNIVKPSWMNIAIAGSNVVFSGTPLVNATGIDVSFDVSNCSGVNTVSFADSIDITTVCIPVEDLSGSAEATPDGIIGVPYNYTITLKGTAPFAINDIVSPSWMLITLEGNMITFSGTPDVLATDLEISFFVTNCTDDQINFGAFIDVVEDTSDGGCCSLQDSFNVNPTADPQINGGGNLFNLINLERFKVISNRSNNFFVVDEDGFEHSRIEISRGAIDIVANDDSNGTGQARINVSSSGGSNTIEIYPESGGLLNLLIRGLETLLSPPAFIAAFDGDKLKKVAYPSGAGIDTNFAANDLTATGNREHNFDDKNLSIIGLGNLLIRSGDGTTTVTRSINFEPSSFNFEINTYDPTSDDYVAIYGNLSTQILTIHADRTGESHKIEIHPDFIHIYGATATSKTRLVINDLEITPTEQCRLNVGPAVEYADNAAAIAAGLIVGDIYRTGDVLKIVH